MGKTDEYANDESRFNLSIDALLVPLMVLAAAIFAAFFATTDNSLDGTRAFLFAMAENEPS